MFSFIRFNKTWHNKYQPLPHRLHEVRLAKLTFPHLKRTRNKTIQKNDDHRTPSRGKYLLSEQTQSPLDTLSFEDMFSVFESLVLRVKSCRSERGRLGTCWFQTSLCLGRLRNRTKMARVEQQCATDGSTSTPYLQLSYFTIYLTQGIEILEYYTKVSW